MAQRIVRDIAIFGAIAFATAIISANAEDAAVPAAAPTAAPQAAAPPAAAPEVADPNAGWEEVSTGLLVKVTSLTRTKHQTMKLRYKFKNTSSDTIRGGALPGAGNYHMDEVYLRHIPSRIEFKPLYSSASGSFVSSNADIAPGAEYVGWAEFPAAPATVTDMTVAFDKFTIDDVPVK